jgi:hypothetical protein
MPKTKVALLQSVGFIEAMECLPVAKIPDGPGWTYSRSSVVHCGCETVSAPGRATPSIGVTGGTQRFTIPSDDTANRVLPWQKTIDDAFGAVMLGMYQG